VDGGGGVGEVVCSGRSLEGPLAGASEGASEDVFDGPFGFEHEIDVSRPSSDLPSELR
jgi:hypothetical protein